MWRRLRPLSPQVLSSARLFVRQHQEEADNFAMKCPLITFVLGGPGTGKGTQCMKIAETFGFAHISAGDLLRKEINSNSKNGTLISEIIKEGRIVPSEVTVQLIQEAINSSDNHKFLIDGFPRSNENRIAYERIIGKDPEFVLYFDLPEEEMMKRVLVRNQGRVDDNVETIKKRLQVFKEISLPVIDYYSGKGKVHKVNAVGSVEEIFEKKMTAIAAGVKTIHLKGGYSRDLVCDFVSGIRGFFSWNPALFDPHPCHIRS